MKKPLALLALLTVSLHFASAADTHNATNNDPLMRVTLVSPGPGAPTPEQADVVEGLVATRQHIRELGNDDQNPSLSRLTLLLIEQNWSHYACFAVPRPLGDHQLIELYFVLGSAKTDSPDIVIKLADVGAVQWKSTYDVVLKKVRTVEASLLTHSDIEPTGGGLEEKISFEATEETIGRNIKSIADMFGLDVAIPPELFGVKKDVHLKEVTWSEIIDSLIAGTGYKRSGHGKFVTFTKTKD